MNINGARGDSNFNVHIQGMNAINVSALTELIPGGNPFNPSDYQVRGLVITYHGPIYTEYLGGDPDEFSSYNYGLVCSNVSDVDIAELQNQINQVESTVNNNTNNLINP